MKVWRGLQSHRLEGAAGRGPAVAGAGVLKASATLPLPELHKGWLGHQKGEYLVRTRRTDAQ